MYLYLIFHHNLTFSSIPEDHYLYLIDSVYSPLLDLVEEGIPLGLEYTGETLKIIHRLQPGYVERLKKLWETGRCEVIGSGYSQAIFSLMPACVNRWNLAFGQEVYKHLLGKIPEIAYLNEQVYTDSLPGLYREAGYQAVIFDWMNAVKDNSWSADLRYRPIRHNPSGLWFLWGDCIAFQKLQRMIWGEIEREEWMAFLEEQCERASMAWGEEAAFCLYASDAEVFDYRPGGLATQMACEGHLHTMRDLLIGLRNHSGFQFVRPGEVLERLTQGEFLSVDRICTPSYPVRTKKQDKYNVTRWAVTGREATRMNTQCHQLLDLINALDDQSVRNKESINRLQRDLVTLWGSDFRTHTTDEKFEVFRHRMGAALTLDRELNKNKETSSSVDTMQPLNLASAQWVPLQNLDEVYRSYVQEKGRRICLQTDNISLTLLKNRGLAIENLAFPKIFTRPLLGTLPHGSFPDISLGSDFFSGHIVLVTQEGYQVSDLSCRVDDIEVTLLQGSIGLRNSIPMELPGLSLVKTYFLNQGDLIVSYDFYARDLRPATMRMGIWTLEPDSFDRNSLFFSTHLGGDVPERFSLAGWRVLQDQPVNHVVTARHCLGSTEGVVTLGDADKQIRILTYPSELYSVPLLHYEETKFRDKKDCSFFCRLYYTICEKDDVAHVFWKGHSRLSFCIKG